ncbi:hypothetical protein JOC78_000519 [Bacillus ectoiniformans]|uniref:hypothetical protein n=1 Tax=Bacillus ectoiniformans TaxID=1494429 RepID=UPI00195F184B|nr:hypothetical protein [Bacillus ectoiniformans]MBM7647598.1 hypothetical protein [Bacillus ectoiniformans]
MKNYFLAGLVFLLTFLTGCNQTEFTKIKEDSFLFTLNLRDSSLTFINEDREVFADWAFDELYTGGVLFPDHDKLLLYGTQLDHADLYSLKKGKKIAEWSVAEGTTGGIYVNQTKEIALANKQDRSVHFFNDTGEETGVVKTGKYPMTLAEEKGMLYVINYQDTILSKVDPKTKKVSKEYTIPSSSTGLFVDSSKDELWVGGHGRGKEPQKNVLIYSLKTGKEKSVLEAPVMPVDFLRDDRNYYVVSHGTSKIYMYNHLKEKTKETETGSNPFAIEEFHFSLAVASYDSDELFFLDPNSLALEKKVKTGKGPFIIFKKEQ